MTIERNPVGKPKDTITKITKIPNARVFKIKPGEANKEYEQLLSGLLSGAIENITSSGNWAVDEDAYLVQVHYNIIKKEEIERQDTDFSNQGEDDKKSNVSQNPQNPQNPQNLKGSQNAEKSEKERLEKIVQERTDSLEFESGIRNAPEKKSDSEVIE